MSPGVRRDDSRKYARCFPLLVNFFTAVRNTSLEADPPLHTRTLLTRILQIFNALARRIATFEIIGKPARRLNNTLRGLDTLPLRIVPV